MCPFSSHPPVTFLLVCPFRSCPPVTFLLVRPFQSHLHLPQYQCVYSDPAHQLLFYRCVNSDPFWSIPTHYSNNLSTNRSIPIHSNLIFNLPFYQYQVWVQGTAQGTRHPLLSSHPKLPRENSLVKPNRTQGDTAGVPLVHNHDYYWLSVSEKPRQYVYIKLRQHVTRIFLSCSATLSIKISQI